MISTWFSSI